MVLENSVPGRVLNCSQKCPDCSPATAAAAASLCLLTPSPPTPPPPRRGTLHKPTPPHTAHKLLPTAAPTPNSLQRPTAARNCSELLNSPAHNYSTTLSSCHPGQRKSSHHSPYYASHPGQRGSKSCVLRELLGSSDEWR